MGCGSSLARGHLSTATRKKQKQNNIMSPELRQDIHEGLGVSLVACSIKGFRKTQEDTSSIVINLGGQDDLLGIGVFDGHSGPQASQYVSAHIWDQVTSTAEWEEGDVDGALRAGFLAVDANMRQERISHGTTAVVAVITPRYLYIANCGDSRAVLCKGGEATALSTDHKPSLCTERARVIRCGGQVLPGGFGGVCRVTAPGTMVAMATSRSLGDFHFKRGYHREPGEQVVSPSADVTCVKRSHDDEFLVLGTDGVWDVLSNQEVCNMMANANRAQRPHAPVKPAPKEIGQEASVAREKCVDASSYTVGSMLRESLSARASFPPTVSSRKNQLAGGAEGEKRARYVMGSVNGLLCPRADREVTAVEEISGSEVTALSLPPPSEAMAQRHVKRLTTGSLSPPSSWVCSDVSDPPTRIAAQSCLSRQSSSFSFCSSAPPSPSSPPRQIYSFSESFPSESLGGTRAPDISALLPELSLDESVSPPTLPSLFMTRSHKSSMDDGMGLAKRPDSLPLPPSPAVTTSRTGAVSAATSESVPSRVGDEHVAPLSGFESVDGICYAPSTSAVESAAAASAALEFLSSPEASSLVAPSPAGEDEEEEYLSSSRVRALVSNGELENERMEVYAIDGVGGQAEHVSSVVRSGVYVQGSKAQEQSNGNGWHAKEAASQSKLLESGGELDQCECVQDSAPGSRLAKVTVMPSLPPQQYTPSADASPHHHVQNGCRNTSGEGGREDADDEGGLKVETAIVSAAAGVSGEVESSAYSLVQETHRSSGGTGKMVFKGASASIGDAHVGAMAAAQGVLDLALSKGSQDNMTLIAVDLRGFLGETPVPSPLQR